jgi:hypothetical protein
MKLHVAFLLVVLTALLPPLTTADEPDLVDEPDLDLEAVLSIVSSSVDDIIVRLEIKNNHPEESRFFLRSAIPDNLVADVFTVQRDAELVQYLGISLKQEAEDFPDGYEEILPGSSIVTDVEILPLFDFTYLESYSISYSAADVELACDAVGENCILTIPSNSVTFVVETASFRFLREMSSQNIRRLADTFDGCTEDQTKMIKEAKAAAIECVAKSCECLETLKGDQDNKYFEMFFGNDKKQNIKVVQDKFKLIKRDLAGMITYFCSDCEALKPRTVYAYVYPSQPGEIYLCPAYFNMNIEGKDTKKGTLVHEVSHFGTGAACADHAYGLKRCKRLAKKSPRRARNNADSYEYFCECLREGGNGAWGDPHFKTWLGSSFDFHGECDLILLDAPSFDGGRGLQIHVRTQLSSNHQYSYVSGMAIQIGKDILEVAGHGDYFFNGQAGEPNTPHKPKQIAGHPMYYQSTIKKRHTFTIDLPSELRLTVAEYRSFVSVSFNSSGLVNDFEDSVGLMGSYVSGNMFGRDGISVLTEPNAFGFEWQVRDTDANLFHDARPPQYPMTCVMPDQEKQRRALQESTITTAQAEEACANWPDDEKEACVFDVLATEDLEMASLDW